MGNVAKKDAADAGFDLEIETAVRCAAMSLAVLPEGKRALAAAMLAERITPPKAPQRGGVVLQNVITLFKDTQRTDWSAEEVVSALSEKKPVEPKKVYSALTYLKGREIIQRVGYGRYRLANGALLITHEMGGD